MNNRQLKRKIVAMKGNRCHDCGGVFPDYCYDLDHRDPAQKAFIISQGYHKPLTEFTAELDKCDLVCAICHRIRTHCHPAIIQKLCKPHKRKIVAKSPAQRQRECRARKMMRTGDKVVSFYSTLT